MAGAAVLSFMPFSRPMAVPWLGILSNPLFFPVGHGCIDTQNHSDEGFSVFSIAPHPFLPSHCWIPGKK